MALPVAAPQSRDRSICFNFPCHFPFCGGLRQRDGDPKGPEIEKIQSRLKFSISLENFNLD